MTYPDLDEALSKAPGTVLLLGVAGSHAFGLAHDGSDVDYRGVYVVPTKDLFRLKPPATSFAHNKPDIAMHEVGRFIEHAAKANPTALEALHYKDYTITSPIGLMLLARRDVFITEKIRATHLGFAKSQFEKMLRRHVPMGIGDVREVKHAQHTLRIVRLTEKVLTTGVYDLTVEDRDEIFSFGALDAIERIHQMQDEIKRIEALPSVLPPGPDLEAVDNMLIHIRQANWFVAGDNDG